jgi:SAM-dependent methyltransferase
MACWRSQGGLLPIILAAGSFVLCQSARSQEVVGSTNRYAFRQVHNPDGIGKFYMGREIARVMGHESAAWLERPERVAEEQPDQLVSLLNVRRGATVADIGAGTGYFSRRLAQAVGPTGRVLAEDVQPEMLTLLTNQAARLGLTNITPVLGTPSDPRLPAASVDLALMVDVYHEFDLPYEMAQAIGQALRPGGLLVLVEYRGEDPRVPIKPLHKMTEAQVKREMSVLPLVWVQTIERLPRQHIIACRKRTTGLPAASALVPVRQK